MNKREYQIPEGYEARIEGNKVILEPKESEDERIRKHLVDCLKFSLKGAEEQDAAGCSRQKDIEAYKWGIAYLEKQGKEEFNEASYKTGIKRVLDNPESYGLEKHGSQNLANSAKTCKDEQNLACSDEDERVLSLLLNNYKQAVEHRPSSLTHAEVLDIYNWLKSLKERYTWKPSDEQMRALEDAKTRMSLDGYGLCPLLQTLINDLKKLKG